MVKHRQYDPAIPLLRTHTGEIKIHVDTKSCTQKPIAAFPKK